MMAPNCALSVEVRRQLLDDLYRVLLRPPVDETGGPQSKAESTYQVDSARVGDHGLQAHGRPTR